MLFDVRITTEGILQIDTKFLAAVWESLVCWYYYYLNYFASICIVLYYL